MTSLFTALALSAFAANSVFCRLALGQTALTPAHFTWIRLLSGVVVLQLLLLFTRKKAVSGTSGLGSYGSALALFVYALTFSMAYVSLDTGTGALILFGVVQVNMILAAVISGVRLRWQEMLGLLMAFGGFVYLMLPGLSAPPLSGFLLMSISGVAWGIYTLRGRGSQQPLADTTANFTRSLPLTLSLLALAFWQNVTLDLTGVFWAIMSGSLASGVGYTLWYRALRGLSALQASVLQLLVPVIAAGGGVVFLGELLSFRLMVSAVLILGGILLIVLKKRA